MISQEDILKIREKIKKSARPLFFFDDDPDGVASFILLYKMTGEGKGVCVKGKPILEEKYARKVEEYGPDLVVVLDKPLMEQEFSDAIKVEKIWIDHHPPQDVKGVQYFNPRINDDKDNRPTSYWAYQIAKEDVKDSFWIAMTGIVGDWNLLLADEFRKEYPELLPEDIDSPERALYESKIGKLVKIFDFNLKGRTSDVMKSIKILTRIKSPHEILDQTTPKGRFIYKKFASVNSRYEELMSQVQPDDGPILIFRYEDNQLALSSQISNELQYKFPDKIIMVIREKRDELMMSIRGSVIKVNDILQEALKSTTGYGGGHDNACGACVKKIEFEEFIEQFRKGVENELSKTSSR